MKNLLSSKSFIFELLSDLAPSIVWRFLAVRREWRAIHCTRDNQYHSKRKQIASGMYLSGAANMYDKTSRGDDDAVM